MKKTFFIGCILLFVFCAPKKTVIETEGLEEVVVFGEEETGLTGFAQENADMRMQIPMYGFTQSFNISVSAAITLYSITTRLRNSQIDWHLSEAEILDLKYRWSKRVVSRGDLLEKKFLDELSDVD